MDSLLRAVMPWAARILFVLIIVFYAEEDWRGMIDWSRCQHDFAAKGESIDLCELVPRGRAEDDLSKRPIFAPLFQSEPDEHAPIMQVTTDPSPPRSPNHFMDLPKFYPKWTNFLKGEPTDLAAWQKYYRSIPEAHLTGQAKTPAQDVLQVLSRFDPQMNEVTEAMADPAAYWPTNYEKPYEEPSYYYLSKSLTLAKLVQLRSVAYLDNGQVDLAEKDFLLPYALARPLFRHGTVTDLLMAFGGEAIDRSVLWEGLRRHAWNDQQLREMESTLADTDLLTETANCLRTDRAAALQTIKVLGDAPEVLNLNERGPFVMQASRDLWLRPSGWKDGDKADYCRGVQRTINSIHLADGTLQPIDFGKAIDEGPTFYASGKVSYHVTMGPEEMLKLIYHPLCASSLPGLGNILHQAAEAETFRRFERLACRLEEFRIAHGQYPDKLEDLPDLPPHLNQEVFSMSPLHYSRKGDGYLLYSSGWQQKDSDGLVHPDITPEGNRVWPSP